MRRGPSLRKLVSSRPRPLTRWPSVANVACPVCGGTDVEKAIMAPRVSKSDTAPGPAKGQPAAAGHGPPAEADLPIRPSRCSRPCARIWRRIRTYVGKRFASEARAMHLGDKTETPIHGEASPEEARALIEDGGGGANPSGANPGSGQKQLTGPQRGGVIPSAASSSRIPRVTLGLQFRDRCRHMARDGVPASSRPGGACRRWTCPSAPAAGCREAHRAPRRVRPPGGRASPSAAGGAPRP